jgi:DNA polymerase
VIANNHNKVNNKLFEHSFNCCIDKIAFINIVKCSIKSDINIADDIIDKCIDYTKKQIDIGSPKLIVTLGNVYNYMTKKRYNISEISGNISKYNGIDIFPILDPEFVMKNPSYKNKMDQDIEKLRKIMEKICI